MHVAPRTLPGAGRGGRGREHPERAADDAADVRVPERARGRDSVAPRCWGALVLVL